MHQLGQWGSCAAAVLLVLADARELFVAWYSEAEFVAPLAYARAWLRISCVGLAALVVAAA